MKTEPAGLQVLRDAVARYRADALSCDEFVAIWRREGAALCAQLPPVYRMALDDLMTRTESSRLFAGDSCSFSRDSLLDACAAWIEKAKLRLLLPDA